MKRLLIDSGPLIATADRNDALHAHCVRLLAAWRGQMLVPEPVLTETCGFLRNQVRGGNVLEAELLERMVHSTAAFEIIDPVLEDRTRAAELVRRLVGAPMGYVDAMVIALAERLYVTDVATIDWQLCTMAMAVSKIKPISWVRCERA